MISNPIMTSVLCTCHAKGQFAHVNSVALSIQLSLENKSFLNFSLEKVQYIEPKIIAGRTKYSLDRVVRKLPIE